MSDPDLTPITAVDWAAALGFVIRLHDRELDSDFLAMMVEADLAGLFAGLMTAPEALEAVDDLVAAIRVLAPNATDGDVLDNLAADYCDIYLSHSLRIAPTGSVWMTDDHLERQDPMFAVRDWYSHYGLTVPEWRIRSDDHLVHELQFVQHLLSSEHAFALTDAAQFLDAHVLPWAPDFCAQMHGRAREPFYRASGSVTLQFLEELRDWMVAQTGRERQIISHAFAREADRRAREQEARATAKPFVPGLEASW